MNDTDLIEAVIAVARDPGYVLIGAAERVYRCIPDRSGEVERVPVYEDAAVHQLITEHHLRIGGGHRVRYGRYEGHANSVLVPKTTRAMAARWSALRPPRLVPTQRTSGSASDPTTDPPCTACHGSGVIPINRQAVWTSEKGAHRPTGTTPCHHCRAREDGRG